MDASNHTLCGPTLGNVRTVNISPEMIAELDALAEATPKRNLPWTVLELDILRRYKDKIPRDQLTIYINQKCGNNRTRAAVDHKARDL